MSTNNENGRKIAIVIGVYLLIKSILNMIIGGGLNLPDILLQAVLAVALYTGFRYLNIGAAIILMLGVVANLGNNLSNFPDSLIYLIEAALDCAAFAVLLFCEDVKEHFTNNWGANQ